MTHLAGTAQSPSLSTQAFNTDLNAAGFAVALDQQSPKPTVEQQACADTIFSKQGRLDDLMNTLGYLLGLKDSSKQDSINKLVGEILELQRELDELKTKCFGSPNAVPAWARVRQDGPVMGPAPKGPTAPIHSTPPRQVQPPLPSPKSENFIPAWLMLLLMATPFGPKIPKGISPSVIGVPNNKPDRIDS